MGNCFSSWRCCITQVILFYFQAQRILTWDHRLLGLGIYIAALAAIGVLLIAAYMFRSPTDNIKDSFNTLKKDIESKMNTHGKYYRHRRIKREPR